MNTTTEPSTASVRMLAALNGSGKHIYGGTVRPNVIAKRRAKSKRAKQSRRLNRVA